MKDIVIVESPFAGDVAKNLRYLRACMRDCLKRGEAPYASHAIYTQPGVLDDGDAAEREQGIQAGFAFRQHAVRTVFYTDLGESRGMQYGRKAADALQAVTNGEHEIVERTLGPSWEAEAIACEESFKTQWPVSSYAEACKATKDEAMQLLEGFCDVIGFVVPDRTKFIEASLREMVGAPC